MKILVTGSSGFIGAACCRTLEVQGHRPLAPSSTELDLLDEVRVRAFIEQHRPTHLLHVAWRAVHGDILESAENLDWLKASLSLIKIFREAGGRRAACVGSSAEYDWSYGICRVGTTPLRPATAYGAAKHALRIAAVGHAKAVGLSFVWPRAFDVYGPGERPSRLSSYVLQCVLSGRPAELTHGQQIRDYLYIDDVAEGIVAALMSPYEGDTDIAGGTPISVRDLAIEIARQAGREDLVHFGARPSPEHDVPIILGDGEHAWTHVRWKPRFTLELGVSMLVAWGRNAFTR